MQTRRPHFTSLVNNAQDLKHEENINMPFVMGTIVSQYSNRLAAATAY